MATLAFIAIAIYAFNAYKHEMIVNDDSFKALQAESAATKVLAGSHEVFIQGQAHSDSKLESYFTEARADRDKINTTLTALGQHLTDQDQRLDRIERKIDNTPSR